MKQSEILEYIDYIGSVKDFIKNGGTIVEANDELKRIIADVKQSSSDIIDMLTGKNNYLTPLKTKILAEVESSKKDFNEKEYFDTINKSIIIADELDSEIFDKSKLKIFRKFIISLLKESYFLNKVLHPEAANIVKQVFDKISKENNTTVLKG